MNDNTNPTMPCKINGKNCLIGESPITYNVDFVGLPCEDTISFSDKSQTAADCTEGVCNILPNNLVMSGCAIYRFVANEIEDLLA